MSQLVPPNGLEEIIQVFGDIDQYLGNDGRPNSQWVDGVMQLVNLPFPIKYHSNPSQNLTRLRCHHKLTDVFAAVFNAILNQGLKDKIKDCDGCYCFREKSSGNGELSVHSWGIAIDLNVSTNKPNTPGDMAPELITLFKGFGFEWGGDWSNYRDPMHFQYCTGY